MPWCPKCGMEYRNGFKACSECGIELVDELEQKKEEATDYDKEVLLTSVANDIEANIIESLHQPYEIPVFRKSVDADAYLRIYMGGVIEGIDIYVPSRSLEKAKEIIASRSITNEGIEEDNELFNAPEVIDQGEKSEVEYEREFNRKRRIRTWIILGVFFIPGLVFVIIGSIYLLIQIFTGEIGL